MRQGVAGRAVWSALFLFAVLTGCSGAESKRAQLAGGCTLNSDCDSPLVCAFRICHTACLETRDCPAGERCVASDKPFHVCQLGSEVSCTRNSDCHGSQVCGVDNQCRDQCVSDRDCLSGQTCTQATCADSVELNSKGVLEPATGDAGSSGLSAGIPCSYNSDCTAPLICRAQICAEECRADVDCSSGQTCLDSRCVPSSGTSGGGGLGGASSGSSGGGPGLGGASGTSGTGAASAGTSAAGSSGCMPTTCQAEAKNCGVISDGCGKTLDCGPCAAGSTCGGGGIANVCGKGSCSPQSCASQGKDCGLISDGCSWLLQCGTCTAPATCGGGGTPNQCGCVADNAAACKGLECGTVLNECGVAVDCGECSAPETCGGAGKAHHCGCQATTCAAQHKDCGTIADGCGGTLDCGGCASGACGGGSAPNVCGPASCSPVSCTTLQADCGTPSDGCSALLSCGTCKGSNTCGGGGKANSCGCTPTTCTAQNKNCGVIPDGCGSTLDCGGCGFGSCGGGGKPNVCGCEVTKSCASEHKDCGVISDGCGGLLSCGSCASPNICGGGGVANVCAPQATPPSCLGGGQGAGHTCGSSNDDCCSSLIVKGGKFNRSNDPAYPGLVSDFRLDRYEVTVGRFRAFLAAGQGVQPTPPVDWSGAAPAIANSGWNPAWKNQLATSASALTAKLNNDNDCSSGSGWGLWTATPAQSDNNPMNCVTWYEAMAFCAWDGGWVPTEEQYNYAQAGGDQQRGFPWTAIASTETVDYSFANFYGQTGAPNYPLAVGSKSPKGDGRYGQSDLVGNMSTWMLDVWNTPYLLTSCSDCAYLGTLSSQRVIRGGSWNDGWNSTAYRANREQTARDARIGFRCARLP